MLNRNNKPIKRNKVLQSKGVKLSRSGRLKTRPVSDEKKQQQIDQREKDSIFYAEIRVARGPYSEISGTYIGSEHSSANYHHIVAKAGWPAGRYIHENVIILTIDEHANVESDPNRYEEVNKRREEINSRIV